MQFEDHFRAMNTDIDVAIIAGEHPAAEFMTIRLLFATQEQRFSRFIDSSLVSRLNRGERVEDPWLARLGRYAVEASASTGGLFNPLVLPSLEDAGYNRSFEQLAGGAVRARDVPLPAEAIGIDGESVWLRSGRFDGGGIVKGWTVDLAVEHLLDAGHDSVLVNAGGDLRAEGRGDTGNGWIAAVTDPFRSDRVGWHGAITGALATSTTLRRRWNTADGGSANHLIDPRTGMPAQSPYVQVSCRAAEARLAEVWAKSVLIGGRPAFDEAVRRGIPVLAIESDGSGNGSGFEASR